MIRYGKPKRESVDTREEGRTTYNCAKVLEIAYRLSTNLQTVFPESLGS